MMRGNSGEIARAEKLLKELKGHNPNAHITYFPMEGKHSIWLDTKRISGFHEAPDIAIREGIEYLKSLNKD